jgi:hypothetical protein
MSYILLFCCILEVSARSNCYVRPSISAHFATPSSPPRGQTVRSNLVPFPLQNMRL